MTPMMHGILAVVVAVAFAFLAFLAVGARNIFVRIVGALLAGVVTVVAVLVAFVDFNSMSKLNTTHAIPAKNVKVAETPQQLARGEQLAKLCVECHSSTGDLPLGASTANLLGEGNPIADLFPPNLTPGSDLKNWSDGEIIRAIREGVDREGKALIIMPSEVFHNYADADVEAVVAYLRSQPSITNTTPERKNGRPRNTLAWRRTVPHVRPETHNPTHRGAARRQRLWSTASISCPYQAAKRATVLT